MTRFALEINSRQQTVDADPEMPLLWVLRDLLNMTGTKYGCGIGLCGACTVQIDGVAARSCQTPIATAAGKRILTLEGLAANGPHSIQDAWIAEQVPQCGYCQPGQIMSAAALLAQKPHPPAPISTHPWPALSAVAPLTSSYATSSPALQERRNHEYQAQSCAS